MGKSRGVARASFSETVQEGHRPGFHRSRDLKEKARHLRSHKKKERRRRKGVEEQTDLRERFPSLFTGSLPPFRIWVAILLGLGVVDDEKNSLDCILVNWISSNFFLLLNFHNVCLLDFYSRNSNTNSYFRTFVKRVQYQNKGIISRVRHTRLSMWHMYENTCLWNERRSR